MTNSAPIRPHSIETLFFEPDQQEVLAVLPGALWLSPGDVVELDEPPRDARVLSTRLQLRGGGARLLVILDVVEDRGDALRGETPTDVVLGGEIDDPAPGLSAELDRDLVALATDMEPAPEEGSAPA